MTAGRTRDKAAGLLRRVPAAAVSACRGLAGGVRPMLAKELRSRTRGWRSPAVISLYLLALGGLSLGMYALMARGARFGPGLAADVGLEVFRFMALFQLMLMAFIVPALTTGAISGERERRTFDLLLVTRVSPVGIVLGKLLSSILYVLLLLAVSLPVLAVVYFFGGVPLGVLFTLFGLCAATAVAYGAVGLFFSALFKRTQVAAVATYATVLFLVFGSVVVTAVLSAIPRYPPPTYPVIPWTAYLSPLSALASLLPLGGMGGGGMEGPGPMPIMIPLLSGLMGFMGGPGPAVAMKMARARWVGGERPPGMPEPPEMLDPWAYHLMFDAAMAVVLLALAALLVAPVRPWHGLRGWIGRRLGFRRRGGQIPASPAAGHVVDREV